MDNDKLTITLLVLMCMLLIAYAGFTTAAFNQEVTRKKAAQESLNWLAKEFQKVGALNAKLEDDSRQARANSFPHVMHILMAKSRQLEIPINVSLALMQIESNFNPRAISSTGDHGLLQINEKYWKFDKAKIYDPETNIDLGLKILKQCYLEAGSWPMAMAVYNAGKNREQSEHPRKLEESMFVK
jgi:soluble lytic murein transglycosylase-like protein